MKGYSLARVTHLDIEHERLDNLIPPKRGGLHRIRGIKEGIEIELEGKKEIEGEKGQGWRVYSHLCQFFRPQHRLEAINLA